MKLKLLIFPALFFTVILLSWKLRSFYIPYGFFQTYNKPNFTLNSFINTAYQKDFEKYLSHRLPSLANLLVIKNDLYDILNFGQYHAGYNGAVVQGRDGILFEKNYLICSWGYTTTNKVKSIAEVAAEKLAVLQKLLARRGITLMLLMAPSKVDFFSENTPWQYTARKGSFLGSSIAGPIYAKAMENQHVPFVDCYEPLARGGQGRLAFPDRGIHWSMYGAGMCLQELSSRLHELNQEKFPTVKVIGISRSSESRYSENDMAEQMNVWPPYKKGRNYYYLADLNRISRPVSIVFYGDSFMQVLMENIRLSGYSTDEISTLFDNRTPSREQFIHSLIHADAVILIGNVTKFVQPYFDQIADVLIDYLENVPEHVQPIHN